MPRISRRENTSTYVHVMIQGIKRENIFQEEKCKSKYLNLVKSIFNEYERLELLVYCVMDNHVHLLVYIEESSNLSKAMCRINTRYALWYNKNNDRVGYVFRDRYRSKPIMDREQLYNTISYIHKNPVKAGIVSEMKEYSKSSYSAYKKRKMKKEIVKLLFNTSDYMQIFDFIHKNYNDFENDILEKNRKNEAVNQLILKFCDENKNSLAEIKKDNKLLLLLVDRIKEKIDITNKELSYLLGIGKNRIRDIRKRDQE